MMKLLSINLLTAIFLLLGFNSFGQLQLSGKFTELANEKIQLIGFEGFDAYEIASTQANENGEFSVNFSNDDYGMGYLSVNENQNYILILEKSNIQLEGKDLASTDLIRIVKGDENKLFSEFSSFYSLQRNAVSAWNYLGQLYQNYPQFQKNSDTSKLIRDEILHLQQFEKNLRAKLPKDSYVSWFIPIRKVVSEVQEIAQRNQAAVPQTIDFFRKLDYTDERLYKSGLFRESIEMHYWLIENSGKPLDLVYQEMNKSTDLLTENLKDEPYKLNEVTAYLFQFLEKRSLFTASEYLAESLLNDEGCVLEDQVVSQLEIYRKMKIGNKAPDIEFPKGLKRSGANMKEKKLSEINSNYKVIAFGSSWCPACVKEIPKLQESYPNWKEKGVEIVFISLDTDPKKYSSFANQFSFLSYCDFGKWQTKAVKDYFVNATPTLYLLDKDNNILSRPNSYEHLKAWIEQKI